MRRTKAFYKGITEKELKDFRANTCVVECQSVEIRERGENKVLCSGPGSLSISAQNGISYKIYTELSPETRTRFDNVDFLAGQIIPESSYYDMRITDVTGRVWNSARMRPDQIFFGADTSVIDGMLDEIHQEEALPFTNSHKTQYRWQVFEKVEIPTNEQTNVRTSIARGRRRPESSSSNVWRFRCLECDFLLISEPDMLRIEMDSERQNLSAHFSQRIIETLQFVLGRPVRWSVFREYHQGKAITTFRTLPPLVFGGRGLPPLPRKDIVEKGRFTTRHHRKLFGRYLRFVQRSGERQHHLWGLVNTVYESSAGSFIDIQALTLTVAIEALLQNEFAGYVSLTKRELEEVRAAQKFVRTWVGSERIANRLHGLAGQLSHPRAKDKMDKMVACSAITAKHVSAWQKLRNLNAHDFQSGKKGGEALVNLMPEVTVLFYHLIFHLIGYKGIYVDYATHGWPFRMYPQDLGSK